MSAEAPKSTITLDTQYYQKLCEVIIDQNKMIDLQNKILKQGEREVKLKDKIIRQLKGGLELRDRLLIRYDQLKEMVEGIEGKKTCG